MTFQNNLTFVVNNLDKGELLDYDSIASEDGFQPMLMDWMQEAVEAGNRFSLKWDDRGQAPFCTMIPSDVDDPNYGYAVSGRGNDITDAIGVVWYKFEKIAQGNLSVARVNSYGRG